MSRKESPTSQTLQRLPQASGTVIKLHDRIEETSSYEGGQHQETSFPEAAQKAAEVLPGPPDAPLRAVPHPFEAVDRTALLLLDLLKDGMAWPVLGRPSLGPGPALAD